MNTNSEILGPRDRVFVSGIAMEDGMDHLAGGHGSLEGRDEADELLVPMPGHAAADDLTFEHAQSGEQGRRAVALVIVGRVTHLPWLIARPGR